VVGGPPRERPISLLFFFLLPPPFFPNPPTRLGRAGALFSVAVVKNIVIILSYLVESFPFPWRAKLPCTRCLFSPEAAGRGPAATKSVYEFVLSEEPPILRRGANRTPNDSPLFQVLPMHDAAFWKMTRRARSSSPRPARRPPLTPRSLPSVFTFLSLVFACSFPLSLPKNRCVVRTNS